MPFAASDPPAAVACSTIPAAPGCKVEKEDRSPVTASLLEALAGEGV